MKPGAETTIGERARAFCTACRDILHILPDVESEVLRAKTATSVNFAVAQAAVQLNKGLLPGDSYASGSQHDS